MGRLTVWQGPDDGMTHRIFKRLQLGAVLGWTGVLIGGTAWAAQGDPPVPLLEFVQPTNNAVFSTLDEIPILLRAFAPNDVFTSAEIKQGAWPLATALYCCLFCPCARPMEGQETTLQIPVPYEGGMPPERMWQGWTNVHAGHHTLTARAVGEGGTVVEAAPVTIVVVDLTLRVFIQPDGAAALTIPQGSLVMGGYDLEASEDLREWVRLGPFSPGNVAAFYWDPPPEGGRRLRFYRSIYTPALPPP